MGLHQGGKKWAKEESIIQRCLAASPLGVVPTKLSIYNNVTSDHSETSLPKLLSYYIPRLSPCDACDLFFCAKWYICWIWWPFILYCCSLVCYAHNQLVWPNISSAAQLQCKYYLTVMNWNSCNGMLGVGICRSSKDLSRPIVACYWSLWQAVHELHY
jgi:hypothetical protein